MVTPNNSDEESGEAFTDGDFDDTDDDLIDVAETQPTEKSDLPVTETINMDVKNVNADSNGISNGFDGNLNGSDDQHKVNGLKNGGIGHSSNLGNHSNGSATDLRRDSHGELNPSIVGILGGQQNHVRIVSFGCYYFVLQMHFCPVCHLVISVSFVLFSFLSWLPYL